MSVDLSKAKAGGDNVAGNKTLIGVQNNHTSGPGVLERLMDKLAAEMRDDAVIREQIDTLQLYYNKRSHDGIDGLTNKLTHAGRGSQIEDAYEKKELFVKLLNRFSLYGSAQEIFAYLLARADNRFNTHVKPALGLAPDNQIDALISNNIVEPLVNEFQGGAFNINDAIMMGMIYWLAEQCFVRWHA